MCPPFYRICMREDDSRDRQKSLLLPLHCPLEAANILGLQLDTRHSSNFLQLELAKDSDGSVIENIWHKVLSRR